MIVCYAANLMKLISIITEEEIAAGKEIIECYTWQERSVAWALEVQD